jgi:hypothetical protein
VLRVKGVEEGVRESQAIFSAPRAWLRLAFRIAVQYSTIRNQINQGSDEPKTQITEPHCLYSHNSFTRHFARDKL